MNAVSVMAAYILQNEHLDVNISFDIKFLVHEIFLKNEREIVNDHFNVDSINI